MYTFRCSARVCWLENALFRTGQWLKKTALFRAHCQNVPKTHYSTAEHRRLHCKDDERSSLPCSAVIVLQETHCIDAEKLVLISYQLAGFSLTRKHVLATFVHERLRYTLLRQSPPTSRIKWLFVDVDGYKIIKVYKPQLMRLQSLHPPVFPRLCPYAGDFNSWHADWVYGYNSPDGEFLAVWGSIHSLALQYNTKDAARFYSGCWNTGTNPDLAFSSADSNSRLPDKRVLEKFPRSQHRPSFIMIYGLDSKIHLIYLSLVSRLC